ncbi:caspase, EACC1-associated type [Kitasatospora sp. LaBMicrA B282]|uniref:caspase, EACC1-associated type n=1 Tax=Kitasatospora sp. LaBMicrA B282 TaxID=3420949 RepID=UPI003D119CA0
MSGIDFAQSRAILIGTAHYTHGLTEMPAARNSLAAMTDLLTGPLCGWPESRITVLLDRTTRDGVMQEIASIIHDSTDVLLFYYVGHGQLMAGEHLGMALVDTHAEPKMRHSTSLRLNDVRTELNWCKARVKVMILDCCFSGLGTRNTQGAGVADQVKIAAKVEGAYTLTASRASQSAIYEDGPAGLTYFTKIFARVVRGGIPGAGTGLTLADIHKEVAARFLRLDLPDGQVRPEPSVLSVDTAEEFIFARNTSAETDHPTRPVSDPNAETKAAMGAVETSTKLVPTTAEEILAEAAVVARGINEPKDRSRSLRMIASAMAEWNPDTAEQLCDEVIQVARTIEDPDDQAHGMLWTVAPLARLNPVRAERLARSIETPYPLSRNMPLSLVAAAVAEQDYAEALRLAHSIDDPDDQAQALGGVAEAMAERDSAEALRLARTVNHPFHRGNALQKIFQFVTWQDPASAEQLVGTIFRPEGRSHALQKVAASMAERNIAEAERIAGGEALALLKIVEVVAKRDAAEAERLAYLIDHQSLRDKALQAVAGTMGKMDTRRAERLAHAISDLEGRSWALLAVGKTAAERDPSASKEILLGANHMARSINRGDRGDIISSFIAGALGAVDRAEAERVARAIKRPGYRKLAFNHIARAQAKPDPAAADEVVKQDPAVDVRLARTIGDPQNQVRKLLEIVQALPRADENVEHARMLRNRGADYHEIAAKTGIPTPLLPRFLPGDPLD